MRKLAIITAATAASGLIAVAGMGIASAATTGNVGSSDIPRTVFKQERLDAVAEVLNTTTANVQAAHKNKTFATLLTNAGLTKKTFAEKVKAELTTDLEAQGYSSDQVTIALQHRAIVRMHHKK
jgi:hypothetical protein